MSDLKGVKPCPKCGEMPHYIRFPFNKHWKLECFPCNTFSDAYKKKLDCRKSWNAMVLRTEAIEEMGAL